MKELIDLFRGRPEQGPIEQLIRASSGYVLAIPDVGFLSQKMEYDKAVKLKSDPKAFRLPTLIDPNETRGLIFDLESHGTFIPNNFYLVNKGYYSRYLQAKGVSIPNFELLGKNNKTLSSEQIDRLASSSSADRPNLFVVKPTEGHLGIGTRVITKEELESIKSGNEELMVQKFWWPKKEKGGHVRDARVITIDGEPVAMAVREAKDPLIDSSGHLIEFPPKLSRILANIAQGGRLVAIKPRQRVKFFELASATSRAIRDYAISVRREWMHVPDPNSVNLGIMSVDILEGEEGIVVNEVDTYPSLGIFPDSELRAIVKRFIDYLQDASKARGKPILVFDFERILGTDFASLMTKESKMFIDMLEKAGTPFVVPRI